MSVNDRTSSERWLATHSLKARKIDLNSVLRHLGFEHVEKFEEKIRKTVSAKYSQKLFQKFANKDGKIYNVIGSEEQLENFSDKLKVAADELKSRLHLLTSGSYRVFGMITANRPMVILNINTNDEQRRGLFFNEVRKLVEEQLVNLQFFNIVSPTSEECFLKNDETEEACESSKLESAINWLQNAAENFETSKDFLGLLSEIESRKSKYDSFILFSEDTSSVQNIETLLKFSEDQRIKLNVVSYNAFERDTHRLLEKVAVGSGGKFRAFSITETEEDAVAKTTSYFGGTPEGTSLDEDSFLIWTEFEECKQTLQDVEDILSRFKYEKEKYRQSQLLATSNANNGSGFEKSEKRLPRYPGLVTSENYFSSKQWIQKFGIDACKLDFYTYLSGHIFKHCNGVVGIKTEPPTEDDPDFKAPAIEKNVLVNARYCRKFVHIVWKDGEIRHVLLTGSVYRNYLHRASALADKILHRMNFLKEGSRELFGTICENRIYVLIDTSSSMETKTDLVVKKLHQLLDEQIVDKSWFNIVCFDTKINPWRSHLVEVTAANIRAAKNWTKGIATNGSTNTLEALQYALSDKMTEGVYLLTDGRPDQPDKAILQMINLHPPVPVHTISFNCFDKAANDLLNSVAIETGGRFHLYQDIANGACKEEQPRPHVSLDLALLQKEFDNLKQIMRVMKTLRQQCELMEQQTDVDESESSKKSTERRVDQSALAARRKKAQEKKRFKEQKSLSCLSLNSVESDCRKRSLRKTIKGETDSWMLSEDREIFKDEKKLTDAARAQWAKKEEIKKKLSCTSEMIKKQTSKSNEDLMQEEINESDIETWMKFNSLATKKLTLIDALRPTIVRHSAKYVPIIDKYVTGKVFEEIFPDFYINSGNKDEIKYVNPTAVDLEKYEQQVEKQIKIYQEKLDFIVWDALPDDAKIGNFEGEGPISFFENQEKMTSLLEEYDWPLNYKDVELLLDEIKLGYEMIQKSTDLRTTKVEGENHTNNTPKENKNVTSISKSKEQDYNTGFRHSRSAQMSKPKLLRKPKQPQEQEEGTLEWEQNEPNIIDISPVGGNRYSNIEGMNHGEKINKPKLNAPRVPPKRCLLQESKGLHVIAENEVDGCYYPGTVVESDSPSTAVVRFANNTTCSVSTKRIIPRPGTVCGPILQKGDFILAQIPNDILEKYQPGIVLAVPLKGEPAPHHYTIVLWNRKQIVTNRRLLVKISQRRFQESARLIYDLEQIAIDLAGNEKNVEMSLKVTSTYDKTKNSGKQKKKTSSNSYVSPYQEPLIGSSLGRPSAPTRKNRLSKTTEESQSKGSDLSRKSSQKSEASILSPKHSAISETSSKSTKSACSGSQITVSKSSKSASMTRHSISSKRSSSKLRGAEGGNDSKRIEESLTKNSSRRSSEKSGTPRRRKSSSSSSSLSKGNRRSLEDRSPTRLESRDLDLQDGPDRDEDEEENEESLAEANQIPSDPEEIENGREDDRLEGLADEDEPEIAAVVLQESTVDPSTDRPKTPTPDNLAFGGGDQASGEPGDLHEPPNVLLYEVGNSVKDQFLTQPTQEERLSYLQHLLESLNAKNLEQFEKSQNRVNQQIQAVGSLGGSSEEKSDHIRSASGIPINASKLEKSEEVLAKWGSDQWFYKHTVVQDMTKGYYAVKDNFNNMDILSRLEMISEENDADDVIKKDDYVLAIYKFFNDERFGPGKVESNLGNNLKVEFFDGQVSTVRLEDCYKISFHRYVNEISCLFNAYSNWVMKPIVFVCEKSKRVQLGLIWDYDSQSKNKMVVRDIQSDLSFQKIQDLYGPIRKSLPLTRGEHVLAPLTDTSPDYGPGVVIASQVSQPC